MDKCIRDEKGRFARHKFDVPCWSEEKDYQTCIRCGKKNKIGSLIRQAHKYGGESVMALCNKLNEENEILSSVPFIAVRKKE